MTMIRRFILITFGVWAMMQTPPLPAEGNSLLKSWSWVLEWKPATISQRPFENQTWLPPDHPYLRYSGRILRNSQNKALLYWPGTSIRGRFSGSSLAIQLEDGGSTDYQVIIDGDLRQSKILDTQSGFGIYVLAENLSPGEHTFEVFRRTESFSGVSQVNGFFLDAGATFLDGEDKRELSIDFYGDSQTVGACNECGATEQWNDLRQHNHLLAYSALVSRILEADAQIIAVSGIGLTLGYQDVTMAEIWDRFYPKAEAPPYYFPARQPDIIVVNLGQNDYSKGVGEKFAPAYDAWIAKLRAQHPQAWILCLMGVMDASHEASPYPLAIKQLVEARQSQGDARILSLLLKQQSKDHPRVLDHLKISQELLDFMEQNIPAVSQRL